jgi:hypothetical protein
MISLQDISSKYKHYIGINEFGERIYFSNLLENKNNFVCVFAFRTKAGAEYAKFNTKANFDHKRII